MYCVCSVWWLGTLTVMYDCAGGHSDDVSSLLIWFIIEEVCVFDGNCCHGNHSTYFLCACSVLLFFHEQINYKGMCAQVEVVMGGCVDRWKW